MPQEMPAWRDYGRVLTLVRKSTLGKKRNEFESPDWRGMPGPYDSWKKVDAKKRPPSGLSAMRICFLQAWPSL